MSIKWIFFVYTCTAFFLRYNVIRCKHYFGAIKMGWSRTFLSWPSRMKESRLVSRTEQLQLNLSEQRKRSDWSGSRTPSQDTSWHPVKVGWKHARLSLGSLAQYGLFYTIPVHTLTKSMDHLTINSEWSHRKVSAQPKTNTFIKSLDERNFNGMAENL